MSDVPTSTSSKGMIYTVELGDAPLRGRLVGDILESLDSGVKKALRLSVEGRSEISGKYPQSLTPAVGFTVEEVLHHPSRLILKSPRLEDVLFDPEVVDEIPHGTSAMGLFTDGMRDAIDGREGSERVDENLIATFEDLGRTLNQVGRLSFRNGRADAIPVVLQPVTLQKIREFKVETPKSRVVRVAGVVNTIRHSDKAFSLRLKSGHALRGMFAEPTDIDLKRFWGKQAIASGLIHFRSSGRALAIEVRDLSPATPAEAELWAEDPRPLSGVGSGKIRLDGQGPRSGIHAFYGKWPFEQTDEEFLDRTKGES